MRSLRCFLADDSLYPSTQVQRVFDNFSTVFWPMITHPLCSRFSLNCLARVATLDAKTSSQAQLDTMCTIVQLWKESSKRLVAVVSYWHYFTHFKLYFQYFLDKRTTSLLIFVICSVCSVLSFTEDHLSPSMALSLKTQFSSRSS